jgi:hypothetical protein
VADPFFTPGERQSLAGFLSGYRGLTRDAYTLDLRHYAAWCTLHGLHRFAARRAFHDEAVRELLLFAGLMPWVDYGRGSSRSRFAR